MPALETFLEWMKTLGFSHLLLWLLSFAIVYGVLEQIKLPKDRASRGIISLVFATFVLFTTPTALIDVISKVSSNLIIIIVGILIFIIFMEAAGAKPSKIKKVGEGLYGYEKESTSIFKENMLMFTAIFIIIAVLLFIGAGGLDLFGVKIEINESSTLTMLFFGAIILAIGWLIANPGEKEKK